VIRADHAEDVVVAEPRPVALHERREVGVTGLVEQVRCVAVPVGQVLGEHRRAVDAFPDEPVSVDERRHPAPDDADLEAGCAQDLRHLRDVAEHVRQVAHSHRAAHLLGAREPCLQVPDRGLAVDEELVHQRLPRADSQPPRDDERANALFRLRPDLEVVVDSRELAVEREPQALVCLERVEHVVHDLHERHAEGLERAVPLPVPVRVGDEDDCQDFTEPASRPATK
jgi:hypothetical protein